MPTEPAEKSRRLTEWLEAFRHGPRLVVISAALVILSTWLSIAIHVKDQRNAIFTAAEQELRGGILTLSSHARRTIEAVNTTLRSVDSWLYETSKNTRPAPLGELSTVIADIQASNEDPVAIRPISNDGFLFRFAAGDTFRTFVGDRPYFKALYQAKPGTLYLAEPVVSRDSGRHVLPIAMKVRANRYGIGLLVAAVTIEQFDDAYRDLLISATGRIGLVRDDGQILVSIPEDIMVRPDAGTAFLAPLLAVNGNAPVQLDVPSPTGGSGALAAALRLERQPVLVYAAFERDELEARLYAQTLPHKIAGIIATLLTLAIAGWLLHLMRLKERESRNTAAALAQANAANVAKRQFLANMSHELRTPLNAILGFSEVISRAMFGPVEAHYRTYGGDIYKSGKHLLHLVDQLLDVSRIEAGAVTLQVQPCNLEEIVQDALKITDAHRATKQIDVTVELKKSECALLADRGVLRQILINLLSNASKYNREGGSIRIAAHRTNSAMTIVVEDTGQGIPPEDLVQAFEPFKKGDAHLAQTADAGFGLGLPIVRGLVHLMGGDIRLESTVGIGTRVVVQLPLAEDRALDAG